MSVHVIRCRTCGNAWIDYDGPTAELIEPTCSCKAELERWVVEPLPPLESALTQLAAAREAVRTCPDQPQCEICWTVTVDAIESALLAMRACATARTLQAPPSSS